MLELKKKVSNFPQNSLEKIGAHLNSIFRYLKASYKTIVVVAIVAIIAVASTSLVSMMLSHSDYDIYLPSLGTIKTIHVETYWDPNGENKRETLSWDEIETGKSVNTTLYIKSVSNSIVTLNLNLTDWNPEAISDYITISCDYNGTHLNPGEIIPVTMTLSAFSSDDFIDYLVSNEIRRFNFVIHIVASD